MADSDRVAELKRKMQEKALQVKAEAAAKDGAAPAAVAAPPAPATPPKPTATAVTPSNAAEAAAAISPQAAPVAISAAVAEAAGIVDPDANTGVVAQGAAVAIVAPTAPTTNGSAATNGATNGAAHVVDLASDVYVEPQLSPEQLAKRQMNRREFLTYAWGGAMGLVLLGTGVGTFQFMYPRFKAGEFGGKFFIGTPESMPATDAAPIPDAAGKFWLVNTEDEGVKAIYMVCTHLGCLYKWEPSTVRFECPCHGSKFTREGLYIEGPAPRSLDRFEVLEDAGQVVVDTGARINGSPSADSPARAAV